MADRSCPYLGLTDDPSTRLSYPSLRNYCHRARPPQVVNLSFQRLHCSTANYKSCPVFEQEWRGKLPAEIRAERKFSKAPKWRLVLIGVGVFLLGTLGAMELGWLPFQIQWTTPKETMQFSAAPLSTETTVPSQTSLPSLTPPPETPTVGVTLTPSPFPTPGPALETPFGPAGRYLIHLVIEGDSFIYLEDLYNTSEAVIMATNSLIPETILWPGTHLVILPEVSDPEGLPLFKVIYIDQPTDLDVLSGEVEISSEVLSEYNSLDEGDLIQPGRWFIIPQDRE